MKRLISVIFTFTALSVSIQAQDGWERTYGTSKADYGYCVRLMNDGCYIVSGVRDVTARYLGDLWLLKIDANGDTLWTRTYLGGSGRWVEQTSDGGYIVTGRKGYDETWLLRTDADGDTLWSRIYTGGESWCVQVASDGGYVICGEWNYPDAGIWLAKVTTEGNLLWSKTYVIDLFDESWYGTGYSVRQTTDGGYVVAGELICYDYGAFPFILRTNNVGDSLWSQTYLTYKWNGGGATSIEETADGGYIVLGCSNLENTGVDIWIMKTDEHGDSLWTRSYDGEQYLDVGYSIEQTSDGGYIVTGQTFVSEPYDFDLWLLKTDTEGDTVWTRKYGPEGSRSANGKCVQQTSDGGYIITGGTLGDLLLLKTDSLGYVSVEEPLPQICNTHWQLLSTIGPQIHLRFENPPFVSSTPCIVIYDASGRKVDEISTLQSSGVITWGKGHSPGVYFIREAAVPAPAQKVVLVK